MFEMSLKTCHHIWVPLCENIPLLHTNNKGANQTVQMHSLISALVVCSLQATAVAGKVLIF